MRFLISLLIVCFFTKINSQVKHYDISAYFDIENKKINIKQTLKFVNSTKKKLDYLILNDWANSYSSSKSPLGKRLSEEYSLSFQRSTKNQRGYTFIKKIHDNNGFKFDHHRLKNNIDIIKVLLPYELKSGDSISLYIDYEIIIPDISFTGYGINKFNNLNIRDWYFTFSKLKMDNWVIESNLDLNDLSHDLASFKFDITYPIFHTLVSDLKIKESHIEGDYNKISSVKEIRNNSEIIISKNSRFEDFKIKNKTIVTDIDNYIKYDDSIVNKLFRYVDNKTGNNINLNTTNINRINKDSIMKKILKFSIDRLGVYPFEKIVVSRKNQSRRPIYGLNNIPKIVSPFDQSFLFEFNFLKEFLHTYLNHSISVHNRNDYWEKEGVIIYLLMDYINIFYPELKLIGKYSELKILKNRNFSKYNFNEQYRLFENIISSRNINQPIATSLDSLTRVNQKIINPYKTGIGFKMLSEYLDKDIIDESIKEYFITNNLNYNNPRSLKSIILNRSNNQSEWFFKYYLNRKSFKDFSIKKINQNNIYTDFKISNLNSSKIPLKISLIKDSEIVKEKWIELKSRDTIVSIKSNQFDFIEINKNKFLTEKNYNNNLASFNNYKKPFKLILFNDFENVYNKQLYYMPLFSYNLYDGVMPGLNLSNVTLIKKPFTFKINPFYSSKQKKILGKINLKYVKYHENKNLFSTQYFIGASTFHYKENLSYTTFYPSILFTFRNSDLRSNYRQFVNLRYVSIYKENNENLEKYPNYNILNIKYILSNSSGGKGFSFNTNLQLNKSFIKNSFTLKYRNFYKDNRQYNFRIFAGKFLKNSTIDDYFSFSTYRARDYMFSYHLLGRSENSGFYSQQFVNSEGALKSKVLPAYSNDWLLSFNTGITLWQWVEGYYDFALIKNKNSKTKTVFDSGIRLNILTDYFELYFPFQSSLGNELKHSNYLDKVRFKIAFDIETFSGLITRRWF